MTGKENWWLVKLNISHVKSVDDPNPINEYSYPEIEINDLLIRVNGERILWWEVDYVKSPSGKIFRQRDLFPKWRTDPDTLPCDW